jgi:hypothetical protein
MTFSNSITSINEGLASCFYIPEIHWFVSAGKRLRPVLFYDPPLSACSFFASPKKEPKKGAPPPNTPWRRVGALIKLLCYCDFSNRTLMSWRPETLIIPSSLLSLAGHLTAAMAACLHLPWREMKPPVNIFTLCYCHLFTLFTGTNNNPSATP